MSADIVASRSRFKTSSPAGRGEARRRLFDRGGLHCLHLCWAMSRAQSILLQAALSHTLSLRWGTMPARTSRAARNQPRPHGRLSPSLRLNPTLVRHRPLIEVNRVRSPPLNSICSVENNGRVLASFVYCGKVSEITSHRLPLVLMGSAKPRNREAKSCA
jgi:hypothetical protein